VDSEKEAHAGCMITHTKPDPDIQHVRKNTKHTMNSEKSTSKIEYKK